jgi:hypothetical protein
MSGSTPSSTHMPLSVCKDRNILTFYKYYDARHVIVQSKDKAVPVQATTAYGGVEVQYPHS